MKNLEKISLMLLMLGSLFSVSVSANEGMWPLHELDQLPYDSLEAEGLQLTLPELYNPDGPDISDAIVDQKQSTTEHNYLRDGFYAPTRDKEIPATGFTLYILQSSDDVTDRVLAGVTSSMSSRNRFEAIEIASKEIVRQAEEDRDVWCEIVSFHSGRQYLLYTYFLIKDVRLVFAPPEAIGNYGDEIDNWEWPRHCGDFTFLRGYVAPDGSTAEYDVANVPYHSERYLRIAAEGAQDGEFVFIIGFPGKTDRYEASFEIRRLIESDLPRRYRRE